MCLKNKVQRMYISESQYTRQTQLLNNRSLAISVLKVEDIERVILMSKTVNCTEDVVIISNGTVDNGKLAALGDGGKFHPSVIPAIDELQEEITKEVTERTESDKALQINIDTETSARISADQQLQRNIEAEASARDAADKDLEDKLAAEVTARTDADAQLQANLEAEASTRTTADKDLQDQISKEITARTDGDTALQSNVDKEEAARTDADSKLQSSIDNEVDARTKADQSLQDQLTAEIAARTNAEETESNTRTSADQELLNKIDALIKTKCVPTGVVEYFAMTAAPVGWLEANGSAVSRTQYADLFAAVGTMFGTGDGSTTFNLPDLRGEFIRGFDNGRRIDDGRTLGSSQDDAFASHNHRFINEYNTATPSIIAYTDQNGEGIDGNPVSSSINRAWTYISMENTGEKETRPRNVALLACIKY